MTIHDLSPEIEALAEIIDDRYVVRVTGGGAYPLRLFYFDHHEVVAADVGVIRARIAELDALYPVLRQGDAEQRAFAKDLADKTGCDVTYSSYQGRFCVHHGPLVRTGVLPSVECIAAAVESMKASFWADAPSLPAAL